MSKTKIAYVKNKKKSIRDRINNQAFAASYNSLGR